MQDHGPEIVANRWTGAPGRRLDRFAVERFAVVLFAAARFAFLAMFASCDGH